MKPRSRSVLALEALESRDVPAVVFTYTDVDGDNVRITNSLPFSAANTAALAAAAASNIVGGQLQLLDLTPAIFTNTSTTIVVVAPFIPGNNRLVNVGYIDSTGHNLGNVTVKGDLGQIDAGSGIGLSPAINSLKVHSLGRLGTDTQAFGGNLQSDITGKLGSLKVTHDIDSAFVNVTGANGKIGPVTIGGSLIGGSAPNSGAIVSTGDMGTVTIAHNVQGGVAPATGSILSGGQVGVVKIFGSLIGGSEGNSGHILSTGDMGAVTIYHNVQGGSGYNSGSIFSYSNLQSVKILGSLIGGSHNNTGKVFVGGDMGPVTIGHDVLGGSGSSLYSGAVQSIGNLALVGGVNIGGSLIGGSGNGGIIFSGGDMGAVTIGHDVLGGSGPSAGSIGSNGQVGAVKIFGSLVGGSNTDTGKISSAGNMGAVTIYHNVQGGSGPDSGFIFSGAKLGVVKIFGSLIGDANTNSGAILSTGDMSAVTISHDVRGSSGFGSGRIQSNGTLALVGGVTIGGSLIGGSNIGMAGSPISSGSIFSAGDMGVVKIADDVLGGTGYGGIIQSNGKLAGVQIGGSLIGGLSTDSGGSGVIFSIGNMGAVTIGHDLTGGSITLSDSLDRSGYIESSAGQIVSVTIGGSIISGLDGSSGVLTRNASIRAANDIGSLVVAGSIIGHGDTGSGGSPVVISARGRLTPTATTDLAIGSITVGTVADGGRVEFANILAGYNTALTGVNADAQIGAVLVRGDWAASNLVAGASNSGFPSFGDANDAKITGGTDTVGILSRIASITINGQVFGTPASVNSTDHYGFVAEQIGSLTIGTILTALAAGPHNDNLAVGETSDMKLHEV